VSDLRRRLLPLLPALSDCLEELAEPPIRVPRRPIDEERRARLKRQQAEMLREIGEDQDD